MSFFHTKSVAQLHADSENSNLSKDLGVMDLTFLGVGGIIGAGIFVLTGIAAAKYAGPAISISFALAGLLCILVGLAYSEFASMIPSSGSVYSYTFASLGEGMAFLTGWSLLLGYTVTGSAVAVGFSGYLAGILKSYGYIIPEVLLKTPAEGGIINLPAVIIILLLALILIRGTEQSAKLNTALVFITLAAIISFICIATPHVEMANFKPFAPFGVQGILSGTAIVFFSYMGFDAVATSAEECKKPERDLPIGIILSVFICMCLYVAMALSLTGAIRSPMPCVSSTGRAWPISSPSAPLPASSRRSSSISSVRRASSSPSPATVSCRQASARSIRNTIRHIWSRSSAP